MTDGKMTTDLEKQFFSTFGIEPYDRYIHCDEEGYCKLTLPCACCDKGRDVQKYPTITDRILLNLILIMNPYAPPVGDTMEEMKEQVLYWCIRYAAEIKHQVQALFKEG